MIPKQGSLRQIEAHAIPDKHPIHSMRVAYEHHNSIHYHLPEMERVLGMLDQRSLDYCIVLEPVRADTYLDFKPISKVRWFLELERPVSSAMNCTHMELHLTWWKNG